MKRGRKNPMATTSRTLAGNELRKRLRLIGPVIGAELLINPDAKNASKKAKAGRPVWQVLDCEALAQWQKSGQQPPDQALLLQNAPNEVGFDAELFRQLPNSIWAQEPDELVLQLMQVIAAPQVSVQPSMLGWGRMQHNVAATANDALTQAAGAAVQAWGFGRLVVARVQSALNKLFAAIGPDSNSVKNLTSGCDGVLCEFVIEVPATYLSQVTGELGRLLSEMPFALVTIERASDRAFIRLVSRTTALAFEGNPATLVVFNYPNVAQMAPSLSKAS